MDCRVSSNFLNLNEGFIVKVNDTWDFPGGPLVKNSPSNAGRCGFDPWARSLKSHMGFFRLPGQKNPPKNQKNQNGKQKQYCSKFNKDFKKGPH